MLLIHFRLSLTNEQAIVEVIKTVAVLLTVEIMFTIILQMFHMILVIIITMIMLNYHLLLLMFL